VKAIEFRDVTLTLGGRAVLSDVTLEIEQGEFVGVLGPNGAGKSTLMRAVLGLVPPTRGTIAVMGHDVLQGDAAIGYLPQLHSHLETFRLRGWDFVAAVIDGHKLGLPLLSHAARVEVDRVLALIGASAIAQRPLSELSGGERQRLLLAQALIGKPRLLLLDEPLVSLDPLHQRDVVALVRQLQRQLGVTVLFSAHELNPLLGALDRVLYLGGGHAALGTVDEVITTAVLSRLYGAEVEVLRLKDRIFVMSGGHELEHDAHRHGQQDDSGQKKHEHV
jgi:zinc/manganese transport system ATP-binding protein